jgi:hypothetical protein
VPQQNEPIGDVRARIIKQLETCSDDELLAFVKHDGEQGAIELVRKLMIVWIEGSAK